MEKIDPPVALQGCYSFRHFSLEQWAEYVRFVFWRKISQEKKLSGWWNVCQELFDDRKFISFVQVAISVEGSMVDQFLDRYPGVRRRLTQDRDLFAFQTCGSGTNMGDFAKDLSNEKVRIGIAHAFDHILALSLEMLFPGIRYKASTIIKSHSEERYEYEIFVLTNWKPQTVRERWKSFDLVTHAAACASYYINALVDVRKGKFPLLDALRELRNMHNIGEKPI